MHGDRAHIAQDMPVLYDCVSAARGLGYPDYVVDGEEAELALPAAPKAAGLARAFVRENLATDTADATIDAAALCVSELVTNALDHASPPFELRIACHDGRVRIEVSDASDARPVQRPVEPMALRGRGLHFIDQSASCWGVVPREHGKTVWAEIGLAGS
jgi:anti-sigma regulatory factor (Ser/Thr protein kinase)